MCSSLNKEGQSASTANTLNLANIFKTSKGITRAISV